MGPPKHGLVQRRFDPDSAATLSGLWLCFSSPDFLPSVLLDFMWFRPQGTLSAWGQGANQQPRGPSSCRGVGTVVGKALPGAHVHPPLPAGRFLRSLEFLSITDWQAEVVWPPPRPGIWVGIGGAGPRPIRDMEWAGPEVKPGPVAVEPPRWAPERGGWLSGGMCGLPVATPGLGLRPESSVTSASGARG